MAASSSKKNLCLSTSCEVIEEAIQMWKEILERLVESLACMSPAGYVYYISAKQEAARTAPTVRDEADERELVHLIERLQARREASA